MNPLFTSEKIHLRPFLHGDLAAVTAYLNHDELVGRRYLPHGFPDALPLAESQIDGVLKKWGEKERGLALAVVHTASDTFIGHVDCSWHWDPHAPDLSIVIGPEHQRQGYGSAALAMMLAFFFRETVAHNVAGWVSDWNEAGRAFAAAHGFTESGAMRRAGIRNGAYVDLQLVDILRPEWQAQQGGN